MVNNGLGDYAFSKSWIREHLVVHEGVWHVDYAGHESESQVVSLFGVSKVPCPFGSTMHEDEVVDRLYVSMNRKHRKIK